MRLALRRMASEGGEGAAPSRIASTEIYGRLDGEMETFERAFGNDVITWLDSQWPALPRPSTRARRSPSSSTTRRSATFLYDEGLRFGTEYPISEKTLAGRVKQAQPIVDHLLRKREQDKKKITH